PARLDPYHRLRLLFAIAAARLDDEGEILPEDQEVLDARAEILALPSEDQPAAYLAAFRRFAALDEMELAPEADEQGQLGYFPEDDDTVVVLAEILGITLVPDADPDADPD